MREACTGGLNIVRVQPKIWKMEEKWPKMRTLMVGANGAHVQSDQSVLYNWYQVLYIYGSIIPFGRRPNTSGFGNGRAHDLELTPITHLLALMCQAQEALCARFKICWALKYVLS